MMFKVKRWTWIRVAFCGLAIMNLFGFWIVNRNGERDLRDTRQAQHGICTAANESRRSISDLIILSISLGSQGAFDFTTAPTYQQLDPLLQKYLRELNEILRRPTTTPGELDSFVRTRLPQRNCEPILEGKPAYDIQPPK